MTSKQRAEPHWVNVGALERLESQGRALVRTNGHAIAVFESNSTLYACANRCPHEGYPLMEGALSDGCVLTCHWHNWKFDLTSGDTMIGGAQAGNIGDHERIADTIKFATTIVATVPILLLYPFLQKYFVKGVMIGSIKG